MNSLLGVEVSEKRTNLKLMKITGVFNIWSKQNMLEAYVVVTPNI